MASPMEALMDSISTQSEPTTTTSVTMPSAENATSYSPDSTCPTQMSRATNALSKLAASDADSDDEPPVRVPRGKLLAGLQTHSLDNTSESEEDGNGAAAYERIRKQLMSGTSQQKREEKQQSPKPASIATSEDEDDMPVRAKSTRRVISRREKSTTPAASPSPSARSRRSSPGLFVSPHPSPAKKQPRNTESSDHDSDESTRPTRNADLEARVERIRAERLARQKVEQKQRKREKPTKQREDEESDGVSDGENGRRLTQQSKPTRRAGKKAMEEITRNQERIRRNMQLTHKSKTKKKYTTKDLLFRFGFDQSKDEAGLPAPDASSAFASSDVEMNQAQDTPPTSPPSQEDMPQKGDAKADLLALRSAETVRQERTPLPASTKLDKGKGRAPEFQHVPLNPLVEQATDITVRNARTEPKDAPVTMIELSDSDDDLEIVKPKNRFPVFDRLPQRQQQDNPSLLHLRHLAHLTSPSKRAPKGAKSMNIGDLQMSLYQKAREQAHKEREEKIEELRRRGIHIETEEEREKHQLEIEDMVAQFEKARQEDLKLAKMEREEAKKNGETDGLLSSDESEDEDYVASGEENAGEDQADEDEEEAEFELSGSEDEEMADEADDEGDDEDTANASNGLIDEMADEDGEKDDEEVAEHPLDEEMEDEDVDAPVRRRTANRARNVIVDEDDDSENDTAKQSTLKGSPTQQATQDDAMAAFGFSNAGPDAETGLGLTQMFAGTMANLESGSQDVPVMPQEQEQDSLDFLRSLPETQPSGGLSQGADFVVPNSQTVASQQLESQNGPESQFSLGISQLIQTSPAYSRTQFSEAPEPTQDAGFELSRSPAGLVAPASTIDTVMLGATESPIAARKGKLRRGRPETPVGLSDVDEDLAGSGSDYNEEQSTKSKDVFSVMKKAAKKQKAVDNFNKKTSWAKDVVEEQAEESEDEYAGIGGASDDDSGDDDEELQKMIDTNDVKVDERKLAAYFADKSKKDDEKNINQLYKDIMNGGLRRKAGTGAFEMSDSEDEADMRRRKKQREFAKMTKALVSDERIGKIAQNPKQAAFFQTLADHMDDPDYDFLNAPVAEDETQTSQSQEDANVEETRDENEDITVPDSQIEETTTPAANPLKRKATDSQKENRPPPNMRRTAPSDSLTRKPLSFADVQHSVSELLDDPRIIVPDSQFSESESEHEEPARRPASRKPIIDRLTLSRESTLTESTGDAGNMAFHAPSVGAHQAGFRVPSLIRRATSNFSITSEKSSSGASTPIEGGVRRGGTGKSNIHAQAREAEKRAVMEKKEAQRKQALKKKASRARGQRSVLRDLGGGCE